MYVLCSCVLCNGNPIKNERVDSVLAQSALIKKNSVKKIVRNGKGVCSLAERHPHTQK